MEQRLTLLETEMGRATAAGAGYVAVSFPSAAEIQTELTARARPCSTPKARPAAPRLRRKPTSKTIRPRIGLCIAEAWDAIAYKTPPPRSPAYRAIAREWGVLGVLFVSRPGEPAEPGVDPEPPADPATPPVAPPGV